MNTTVNEDLRDKEKEKEKKDKDAEETEPNQPLELSNVVCGDDPSTIADNMPGNFY